MLLRSMLAIIAAILLQSLVPPQAVAAPEPIMSCAAEPLDTTIAYGDKIMCDTLASTDLDIYRFAGAINERVLISIVRTGGSDVCIDLRRSNGSSAGSACTNVFFNDSTALELVLNETSQHSIIVSAGGAATYKLGLDRINPPPTYATSICNGCDSTDVLDPRPDYDFVNFEATANSLVNIRILRVDGNDVCIGLRRPDGTQISSTCTNVFFNNTVAIETTLPETASYMVIVSGSVGTYQLSLQCITGTCVPAPSCNGKTATLWGTDGDNFLVGTEGRDVIVGGGGNDIIYGLGGNDIICGDAGNDILFGGEGNDKLFGSRGSDMLFGDEGDDKLTASSGDDLLFGGSGDDTLKGGSDRDVCEGDAHVFGDSADNACEIKAGVSP